MKSREKDATPSKLPDEEIDKVFSAAEHLVKMDQRREKLRRLQKAKNNSSDASHIADLLKELSNAIELQRNLLTALPSHEQLQPSTLQIPADSVNKLVFAFHRGHQRWYPARIQAVAEEGLRADVAYIGYEEKERLSSTMAKIVEPLPPARLFRDSACAFVDLKSGRVHAAWVVDSEPQKPLLRRKADGVTVSVDRGLIIPPEHAPNTPVDMSNVILPNDSREVRIRKKKAMKRLRYQARSEEINDFFRQRQQSWLAFKHSDNERENLFKLQRRT